MKPHSRLSADSKFCGRLPVTVLAALGLIWFVLPAGRSRAIAADSTQIKGLLAAARIVPIPTQSRDRFFQMDLERHQASGTVAEMVGQAGLASDIQMRSFGLRRAAEASLPIYPADTRALLDAYAQGGCRTRRRTFRRNTREWN